jgi:predicted RNase H-like HicB family nuclease
MAGEQIVFVVTTCSETGGYVARWDNAPGHGGITTQADSFSELEEMIADAVGGYLEPSDRPKQVKLHFAEDPVLAL